MFNHTEYINSFKVISPSVLNQKVRFLNRDKYRGKGRPRKKDYTFKTMMDVQQELNEVLNKKMAFLWLKI